MDILLLTGTAIIFGLLGGRIGNRLKTPAVAGYIITGVILGPSVAGVFQLHSMDRLGVISDLALGLIAFVIGSRLPWHLLKKTGKSIITILVSESLITFLVVALGLYFVTRELYIALVIGALAPATAPGGTVAVLQEYKAKGTFTNTLLAIVGLDDALAIVIYGVAACLARSLISGGGGIPFYRALIGPLAEIGGALLLGLSLGLALAYLAKIMRGRGELLALSLGIIIACVGVANSLHLSLILANMSLGMVVASTFPRIGRRTLDAIEGITPPVYVIFFVTAGAHLQLKLLPQMGLVGLVYILGRAAGKMTGAYLGTTIAKSTTSIRRYLGFGLLSQAGVAIGLAILIGREFSSLGETGHHLAVLAINTIAATTIVFEIIGPIAAKFALTRAGEVGKTAR